MAKPSKSRAKSKSPSVLVGVPSTDMDRKYRAEDALRTLSRADEIKRDGSLMRDLKKLAQQQVAALSKVAGPDKKGK